MSAPGRGCWPGRFPFRALYRARERNCLSSLTLRAGGFDSYCRCWRAGFVCAFARVFRAACSFTAGGEAGERVCARVRTPQFLLEYGWGVLFTIMRSSFLCGVDIRAVGGDGGLSARETEVWIF